VKGQADPPPRQDPPAAPGGDARPQDTQAQGVLVVPLAADTALARSVFRRISATKAIPSTCKDRPRKAWEC